MILLFVTFLLLLLGFAPSLWEVLRPSDSAATPISRMQLQDVRNTKQDFFSILEFLLQSEKWLTIDSDDLFPVNEPHLRGIYALKDLNIKKGAHTLSIAAENNAICEPGVSAYEIHAKSKLTIKENAEVLWWATASEIYLQSQSLQRGKLEAKTRLQVMGDCYFHSLKSKTIEIGSLSNSTIPAKIAIPSQRHLIAEAWTNTESILEGDLLFDKNTTLKVGTVVRGSIRAEKDLHIEKGCTIEGHVFVGRNLISEGDSKISGVVVAERRIDLGPGHHIGREDSPITVSADEINLQGPQRIHGTLRCWEQGQIIS